MTAATSYVLQPPAVPSTTTTVLPDANQVQVVFPEGADGPATVTGVGFAPRSDVTVTAGDVTLNTHANDSGTVTAQVASTSYPATVTLTGISASRSQKTVIGSTPGPAPGVSMTLLLVPAVAVLLIGLFVLLHFLKSLKSASAQAKEYTALDFDEMFATAIYEKKNLQ